MPCLRLIFILFIFLLPYLFTCADENVLFSTDEEEEQLLEGEENICIDTTREMNEYNENSVIKERLHRKCCIFYYQDGNKCKPSWFVVTATHLKNLWIFLPFAFGLFFLFLIFCLLCLCRQNKREPGNYYRNSPLLSRNFVPQPPTTAPPSYNDAVPVPSRRYNLIEKSIRIHNAQYLATEALAVNIEMKRISTVAASPNEEYYERIDVINPCSDNNEEEYATIRKHKKGRITTEEKQ